MIMLKIFGFLYRETTGTRFTVVVTSLLTGLSRGMLLTTLNTAAASAAVAQPGHYDLRQALKFLGVLAVYLLSAYAGGLAGRSLVDNVAKRIRLRIIEKLLEGPLRFIETWGSGELHTNLSADIDRVANGTMTLINCTQSAVLLIFAFVYIGGLTLLGLLAMLIVAVAGVVTHIWRERIATRFLARARAKQVEFWEGIDDMVRGFKELRQHSARRADLALHLRDALDESVTLVQRAQAKYLASNLISESYLFGLIATLVFVIPTHIRGDRAIIFYFFSSVLFLMGPLEALISAIPTFATIRLGYENLERLEQALTQVQTSSAETPCPLSPQWNRLVLDDVHFRFVSANPDENFDVGPLALELRRGEVLFIIGGNGAGKTTLLKLLTGLYTPDAGQVLLDEKLVGSTNYQAYRELFAVVFSDFHLFKKLYGLALAESAPVEKLLTRLQIGHKTRFANGSFSTTQLSTGQRKRLGYAVARLADRQIYVFDEFAADQDPHFRHFFYHELLPELHRQGKTIVAVTHDDRYFDVASRVIKVDYGRIFDITATVQARPREPLQRSVESE